MRCMTPCPTVSGGCRRSARDSVATVHCWRWGTDAYHVLRQVLADDGCALDATRTTEHAMKRIIEPELLDELPPGDPRAAGSRRDLRRLNAWMRNHAIMANALQTAVNGQTPKQITELDR